MSMESEHNMSPMAENFDSSIRRRRRAQMAFLICLLLSWEPQAEL